MKIEDVIDHIGFGRFHIRLICLGCVASISGVIETVIIVFLTFTPDHRCAIPGLQNDSFTSYRTLHGELNNASAPDGVDGVCTRYGTGMFTNNITGSRYENQSFALRQSVVKCDEWVYDKSTFTNTVVTEFNLVCDDVLKIAHSKMAFFVGLLIGALVFGVAGDMIGRKKSALFCMLISFTGGMALPWVSDFTAFTLLRLVIGIGVNGLSVNRSVIVLEFMVRTKRVFAACLMSFSWACGMVGLTAVAYFIQDWRYLQLAVHTPFVLMLSYVWFLPESVRWLLSKGRRKEAEALLTKIAATNKVKLPENFLEKEQEIQKKESFMNILTTPLLLKRLIIMGVNWVAVGMVYYGLMLHAGNLDGDVFINFLAQAVIEIPSCILVVSLLDRVGRRALHMSFMIVGGVSCILTIIPVIFNRKGLEVLILSMATIGKAAATGSFQIVYIYTPELFPTTLRMSAIGASSCVARIGVITAPYIGELGNIIGGDIGVAIPLIIFGGFSVFAGSLCIFLPETKGRKLPDNVEDAKTIGWVTNDVQIELNSPESHPLTTEDEATSKFCKDISSEKQIMFNGLDK